MQKPHLKRWKTVCLEKRKGGLGVRNLSLMNLALLCKWSWRYAIEREALWKQVISQRYGEDDGGWHSCEVSERFDVGLWKVIRKKWNYLSDRLTFQVDNGQRVRFWMDKWYGDEPLYESFPSLFTLSSSKEAWVADVWNPKGEEDGWTPLFSRVFNDWELDLVERFLQKIQATRVHRAVEDRVIWTASRCRTFSVKSLDSI